jgi:hypothetical protein
MSVETKLLVLLPSSTGSLIAICPKEAAAADALTQEVIKTIMGVSGTGGDIHHGILQFLQYASNTAMTNSLVACAIVHCCLLQSAYAKMELTPSCMLLHAHSEPCSSAVSVRM